MRSTIELIIKVYCLQVNTVKLSIQLLCDFEEWLDKAACVEREIATEKDRQKLHGQTNMEAVTLKEFLQIVIDFGGGGENSRFNKVAHKIDIAEEYIVKCVVKMQSCRASVEREALPQKSVVGETRKWLMR